MLSIFPFIIEIIQHPRSLLRGLKILPVSFDIVSLQATNSIDINNIKKNYTERISTSSHFCRIDYLYENINKYFQRIKLITGKDEPIQLLGIVCCDNRTYTFYFKALDVYFEIITPSSFTYIPYNGEFYKTAYVYIKESSDITGLDIDEGPFSEYLIPKEPIFVRIEELEASSISVGCRFWSGLEVPLMIQCFFNYDMNYTDIMWDIFLYENTHYQNFVDCLNNS